MKRFILTFFFGILVFSFQACTKKQLLGPRKLECIGVITYNFTTTLIDTEIYPNKDPRIFSIKLERDYDITGDVSGTWKESGAQILLMIDGDFGPDAQFPIDIAYYETRDKIEIEGKEVDMRQFAPKTYFVVITRGFAGTTEFFQYFVFK